MSVNDVLVFNPGAFGSIGARTFGVGKETTTIINPGEPVGKVVAVSDVFAAATNTPLSAAATGFTFTNCWAGIAVSTSDQTTTADGTVQVLPIIPGVVYLAKPNVAATWDTQTEYDRLVGKRVLMDLTSGAYTILAADNAKNGLVVEPLDVAKHPGKVAFSIRQAASYAN